MLDGKISTGNIDRFCLEDQEILKQYNIQTPANQDQFRIWTNILGTKKIEAKLIRVQNNQVFLQLKTGQSATIKINGLSEADQKLIHEFQKQK
jgi:hypothetical protein